MRTLFRVIQRWSAAVLLGLLLLSVVAALKLPLGYDDDVIRFLPENDPEVERLNEIADRFGSIHVALVGIESQGLFSADVLNYARSVTKKLRALPGVSHVTSLTELAIVDTAKSSDGEGASVFRELVPEPVPKDVEALKAMQADVLKHDYLVGSLVSADATGLLLICQLHNVLGGERLSTKVAAENIRKSIGELTLPAGVTVHYGGAPFIAESVANGSQRDLRRLAPYVCAIILILVFVSLGSWKAALLALVSVGLGILWTMGLMGWLDLPLTLVSTSMPVILVALGSAYAVHLLVWYMDHDDGVDGMLHHVGWPVLIAALTTVAGFLSFLVMDIAPMREFGWQMAVGAGVCGVISLCFIPAVLIRWPIQQRDGGAMGKRVDRWLVQLAESSRKNRWLVIASGVLVAGFFALQLPNIETRMDAKSFFPEGSAPLEADEFMTQHFGGSVYLQVLVLGDISDPAVLRQMAAFEDRLTGVEGVTRVASITQILALVNEARMGKWEIPRTAGMVREFGKLATMSDPALQLLVDPDWTGALIQVGIGGFDTAVVGEVTSQIRQLIQGHMPSAVVTLPANDGPLRTQVIQDAVQRIRLITKTKVSAAKLEDLLSAGASVNVESLATKISKILNVEITEEEMVEVKPGTDLSKLAKSAAQKLAVGKYTSALFVAELETLVVADELEDRAGFERGARYVYRKFEKLGVKDRVGPVLAAVHKSLGPLEGAVHRRVDGIVSDVFAERWTLPSSMGKGKQKQLSTVVSGYPIVQETLTRSVKRNQANSILTSLPLIFIVLCVVFRSFVAGLIGLVPTGLTLLVTFGVMGFFRDDLPLDIGASMLASIALGVGIDYAIHFLWRYRRSGLLDAMHTTGRSIVINALEITAGFVVLAWASIVPMSRFGLMIAQTLLVAALATLVLLPALLHWWRPLNDVDAKGD